MKQLIFSIALLSTLISCKDEETPIKNQKENTVSSIVKEPNDEVVLILEDSIESLPINLRTNSYQIKPDLMMIGNNNNVLIIPTDSLLNVVIAHTYIYVAKGKFMKGDTVNIDLKESFANKKPIKYPYYSVSNRDINLYELNFDYYVSLKTPTAKTFEFYVMASNMEQWENPTVEDDVFKNIVLTADSLYKRNLLSKDFHSEKIAEANTLKSNSYLMKASIEKINIDSLISSLQNNSQIESDFLQNSLIRALNYKYFSKRKKHAKSSELYDTLATEDTLLKSEFKNVVLDRLLTRIYTSQRLLFDDYLKEFKTQVPNDSKYLIKYKSLLDEEETAKKNNAIFKNNAGKLLAIKNKKTFGFNDVLQKEKGKVVLVDFWASWCAPCRMEMPTIKSLEQEVDINKFSVLSISIDESMASWTKASVQEGVDTKKHNYLLIDAHNSKLITDFGIKTIPRYLLFNKKGELVDANAPRPSDQVFKTVLNNLLRQ